MGGVWKRNKRREEIVKEVEALVKQHGRIPSRRWMLANGLKQRYNYLSQQPELFTHLKSGHVQATLEEHIWTAELVVKKYGGIPRQEVCRKYGLGSLFRATRKYPEAFSRFPKEKLARKSIAEHVADAEQLVRQRRHIPSHRQLSAIGRRDLAVCVQKYPDAFAHLPKVRERRPRKYADEQLSEFQTIVAELGHVPEPSWLAKNGKPQLALYIYRRPEVFQHLLKPAS